MLLPLDKLLIQLEPFTRVSQSNLSSCHVDFLKSMKRFGSSISNTFKEIQVLEDTKETKSQLQYHIKDCETEIDKLKQQIHALNKDLASERKQHRDLEALHLQLHTDLQNLVPISNIYQIHDIIYGFHFEILLTFRICFQRLRDNKSLMETSEAQDEHDNVLNE